MSKISIGKIALSIAIIVAFCAFYSDIAMAQATAGGNIGDGTRGGGDGQTLGAVINNLVQSNATVPGLLTGLSYLFGLVLGFMGIMKLKAHAENPNNPEIWDPLKRFLAGGMFFSLPTIGRVVQETVSKDQDVLSGSAYNTAGATSEGLDGKLVDLMQDIWEPMQFLIVGFCYLAGIILIMIGISRLLKTEQEGPKGPTGIGTIFMFLTGGVLLSINSILGSAVNSVFQSGAENNAALTYTEGLEGVAGNANAVIGAVMAFVAIIGWISFIRGFFIMKDVAHGNGQASAMAGITHIIGGAIAVNLGGIINAVQTTLGITQYGLTISFVDPALIDAYATSVTFIV